jgi:hypothetical protein
MLVQVFSDIQYLDGIIYLQTNPAVLGGVMLQLGGDDGRNGVGRQVSLDTRETGSGDLASVAALCISTAENTHNIQPMPSSSSDC